ncbi:MAG TPA: PilZ domain-containing protein [Myxococcota bacterium]|jgi:DNA-binding response OmpR family regulator|nr:PilZ domain-containing protein [Myxococcota bacterium]
MAKVRREGGTATGTRKPRARGGDGGTERQRSILLADPLVPVRRFMKKTLVAMGYAVTEADDLAGLAAGAGAADLVVVSAGLLQGAQADAELQKLRDAGVVPADRPVILLSDRTAGDEPGRVRAAGPQTWLARSASVLEVIFTVNELLFPEGAATRAYGRAYGGFEVEFTPAGAPARAVGLIYNLSRTGAFVETTRLAAGGERLALQLRLPDHERPVELGAEVVRVNAPGAARDRFSPSGFAVKFVDVDAARAATLDRFVDSHRVR